MVNDYKERKEERVVNDYKERKQARVVNDDE